MNAHSNGLPISRRIVVAAIASAATMSLSACIWTDSSTEQSCTPSPSSSRVADTKTCGPALRNYRSEVARVYPRRNQSSASHRGHGAKLSHSRAIRCIGGANEVPCLMRSDGDVHGHGDDRQAPYVFRRVRRSLPKYWQLPDSGWQDNFHC